MDRSYHLLEDSVRLKPHPIFFSKTSPEISMYAKLLLRRNNMKRPSERRRSFILRPNPWYQRRLSNRTDHFLELFLRGRTPAGSFLRMSCVKSSSNNMLCELCNEKAAITCQHCRVAQYCCVEHRKSDSKLHRKKCLGLSTMGQQEHFRDSRPRLNGYEVMDLLQISYHDQAKAVVETLKKQGYCYLDDFHGEDIARKILGEVKELHHRQRFTDGQLVSSNGNGSMLNKKIRDDKIAWIDGKEENCATISFHMARVNALVRECNGLIDEYDIEHRTKAMVACYPGQGTGYKRHVDNPNQDGRCITTLYYLNPGWTEEVRTFIYFSFNLIFFRQQQATYM
ncbi:hypoxia-inducible factor prolyl hydroxylase-like isoform X1 [Orbicella faveolata]|uniref:hypoxia-inducible factor prolyl hydroxylase-like isoform X1 n=2 Tax=Orbicella faveolata TaxID=48498 RepID=UPI0009E232AE|nr:hypoxia-inducible factor prolyl hydroxylase-like isoform X1 [Orbicella faveolata]